MHIKAMADPPWPTIRAELQRCITDGDEQSLKRLAERVEADRLRAHAGQLTGEELLAIMTYLSDKQRRTTFKLLSSADRQRIRLAIRDHYVDYMASLPKRKRASVLDEYIIAVPPCHITEGEPIRWAFESGDRYDRATYAYVLDEADHPIQRIALAQLAWASLAAGQPPSPQPVELALNIRTPLSAAWRFINLGGWNELPVVDDEGAYKGVIYKDVLRKQVLARWRHFMRPASRTAIRLWLIAALLISAGVWFFLR